MSLVGVNGQAISSKKVSLLSMPGSEVICVIEEETADDYIVSYPLKVARTLQGATIVDYIAGAFIKEIAIPKKWVIHCVSQDTLRPDLVSAYNVTRGSLEK